MSDLLSQIPLFEESYETAHPILVLSDSHGAIDALVSIIEANLSTTDIILFLGDGADEFETLRYIYPDKRYFSVIGNNDRRSNAPLEQIFSINGIRFYLTHGHIAPYSQVKGEVARRAQSFAADIALYGHLHQPYLAREGELYIASSGSVAYPRGGTEAAYLLIDTALFLEGGGEASFLFKGAKTDQVLMIGER